MSITIRPVPSHARHLHLGPPAQLGHAAFDIHNPGPAPVALTVRSVAYRVGPVLDAAPVVAEPVFGGLVDDSLSESVRVLSVPPGTTRVTVGFTWVEAWVSGGDRYGFDVTFDVDGAPVTVLAETEVTRVRPR